MNGAILVLVTARLERANESEHPVYILHDPKMKEQVENFKAFSDGGIADAGHSPKAGLHPFFPRRLERGRGDAFITRVEIVASHGGGRARAAGREVTSCIKWQQKEPKMPSLMVSWREKWDLRCCVLQRRQIAVSSESNPTRCGASRQCLRARDFACVIASLTKRSPEILLEKRASIGLATL